MGGSWHSAVAVAGVTAGVAGLTTGATALVLTLRVRAAERRAAGARVPAAAGPGGVPPAVVVFGSRAFPGRPGLELRARLDHAQTLRQAGAGGPVVVTGGRDGAVDEVVEMRRYLLRSGIPTADVLEARPGQNTRASIDAVVGMADRLGRPPWIAVSTPFHAHRIAAEFRRHGIDVIVSGPAQSPEMRDARMHRVRVATEVVASAAYALPRGWLARVDTAPGSWRHTLPRVLAGRGRHGSHPRRPPRTRGGAAPASPPARDR